ncbi:hypothetical protein [Vibrio hangzhouensis]|uniref:Uncharacterized protein n=1 Tax=Vibrio hangzhouensis TaxID=462991 RepID=A0A1H6BDW0_9VIBR|nr:hypothetical protein [Vibrio hangzhouensis]MBY6199376.1 hypothetical protein [Vibrio hangzhouensis]SEG58505.1 hypothetical protein SAMN04488244_12173 [Vibrio hangzhouensis]
MLTTLDRLTIYSVLCFIAFCALVLKTSVEPSAMPLLGLSAAIFGIWIEMRRWQDVSEEQEN